LTSCKTLYVCVKASSFAAKIVFALNKIYRVRASSVVKEMKNVEISVKVWDQWQVSFLFFSFSFFSSQVSALEVAWTILVISQIVSYRQLVWQLISTFHCIVMLFY
jgi:hypothetical protein